MRTHAAVLYAMGAPMPYAESRPLHVEAVEFDGPGPGFYRVVFSIGT